MKTNNAQWAVLIDFLEGHPQMVTHSFDSLNSNELYKNLWKEIANSLNCMGYGTKTPEKWATAFCKWKSRVKGKAMQIKLEQKKTGGGPPPPPLTPIEERLMSIVGWSALGDNSKVLGLESKPKTPAELVSVEVVPPKLIYFNKYKTAGNILGSNFAKDNIVEETVVEQHECESQPDYIFVATCTEDVGGIDRDLPPTDQHYEPHMKKSSLVETPTGKTTNKRKVQVKDNISESKTNTPKKSLNSLNLMHIETLDILKNINNNLGLMVNNQQRLADAQENHNNILSELKDIFKIRHKNNILPNFHDYLE